MQQLVGQAPGQNFAAQQPGIQNIGFRAEEFWVEYVSSTKSELKQIGVNAQQMPIYDNVLAEYTRPVEFVRLVQFGETGRSATDARIGDLKRYREPISPQDTSAIIAKARWAAVAPHYEAWKQGFEIPREGTPLAAWNHLDKQRRELLQRLGLFTIEDVAQCGDAIIARMQFPNARQVVQMAQAFLQVSDKQKGAVELQATRDELAATKEAMEDMRRMMAEMQQQLAAGPKPVEEEVEMPTPPRRSGRNQAERQPITVE